MKLNKILQILLIFYLFVAVAFAQQRLLVIGGGDRTPDILQKIAEESGGFW